VSEDMNWLVSELQRQTRMTVQEPMRLFRLMRKWLSDPASVQKYLSFINIKRTVGERWSEDRTQGIHRREYKSYSDYLEHQASKLQHIDLSDYDIWFRECLAERLAALPEIKPGMSALCLAARIGTEVKAFQDVGCFSVGIDLNPGPNNKYVLTGDFHDIQFPSDSVDVVYTNSLDHAFDAVKMVSEVKRVLKATGIFIVEAPHGKEAGQVAEDYESFWWNSDTDLQEMVERCGFHTARREPIERPAVGVALVFTTAD
jgi:SAM-dependent methyltransferase